MLLLMPLTNTFFAISFLSLSHTHYFALACSVFDVLQASFPASSFTSSSFSGLPLPSLTHTHALSHTPSHTHSHTLTITRTLARTLVHTHAHSVTNEHTLSHSLTHARTLSHSLTHTHTLTHTHSLPLTLTLHCRLAPIGCSSPFFTLVSLGWRRLVVRRRRQFRLSWPFGRSTLAQRRRLSKPCTALQQLSSSFFFFFFLSMSCKLLLWVLRHSVEEEIGEQNFFF